MDSIIELSPFLCRMWALHDRLEEYLTEDSCKAEIESFDKHGQLVPVLGRPIQNDSSCVAELIYGARRLFIARQLNIPLRVMLRQVSDLEAIVAMDLENRQRKDLSPYERALSYARLLRTGHFRSQEDMARVLNVSASQVSRLLKLTKLPTVILSAFASPLDICETWGQELVDAWADPERRQALVRVARAIAADTQRPNPGAIYEQLLGASAPRRHAKRGSREEVISDCSGKPLLRVRRLRSSVVLVLPMRSLSPERLFSITRAVSQILQPSS